MRFAGRNEEYKALALVDDVHKHWNTEFSWPVTQSLALWKIEEGVADVGWLPFEESRKLFESKL